VSNCGLNIGLSITTPSDFNHNKMSSFFDEDVAIFQSLQNGTGRCPSQLPSFVQDVELLTETIHENGHHLSRHGNCHYFSSTENIKDHLLKSLYVTQCATQSSVYPYQSGSSHQFSDLHLPRFRQGSIPCDLLLGIYECRRCSFDAKQASLPFSEDEL